MTIVVLLFGSRMQNRGTAVMKTTDVERISSRLKRNGPNNVEG